MKRIIFLLLIGCFTGTVYAQFTCGTVMPSSKSTGNIPNSIFYIPGNNTPTKYLRVNIHFILREKSDANYPGNFTSTDNGKGDNTYTGYDFAENLINAANGRMRQNFKMNLPLNNTTPVIDKKIQYVLSGVFFHESNNYYEYTQNEYLVNNALGINKDMAINIFMQGESPYILDSNGDLVRKYGSSAKSCFSGNRAIVFRDRWNNDNHWVNAGTFNHEVGHNLSLYHTIIPNRDEGYGGQCNSEDYCSDTPIVNDLIETDGIDPCNDCTRWNTGGIPTCPNNLMGYSGSSALTPQQLGRAHWTIENEMRLYKSCVYFNKNINLTSSILSNASYISKKIIIPNSESVIVDNSAALYLNCEEFVIDGEFEIKKGSQLIVNTTASCE